MIPQMQQIAVEDKKWLTSEDMLDCVAISQSLPGVVAVNAATFIGNKKAGTPGAIAATVGVILPAIIAIVLAVLFLDYIGNNPFVEGAFTGVKAAVCGLIVVTMIRMGKEILASPFHWVLMVAAFAAVGVFNISVVWVVLAGIVIGIAYSLIRRAK